MIRKFMHMSNIKIEMLLCIQELGLNTIDKVML